MHSTNSECFQYRKLMTFWCDSFSFTYFWVYYFICWLLLNLQIKVTIPLNQRKTKTWPQDECTKIKSNDWINPPQQFRDIHFLFLEIQCGGCYSRSFLVCLDPVWNGEWVSLGHAHPQLNCWKAKVLRKGKMGVLLSIILLVFLWIQVKANVAEKSEDTSVLWDRSHGFNRVLCL